MTVVPDPDLIEESLAALPLTKFEAGEIVVLAGSRISGHSPGSTSFMLAALRVLHVDPDRGPGAAALGRGSLMSDRR